MMVMDQICAETTVGSLFWTVGGYQVGENDQKVAKMAKLATRLAISSLSRSLKVALKQGNDRDGSNMCRYYS